MRKRMPTTISGRDVRLEKIWVDKPEDLTIKDVWGVMQERKGDGKWWCIGGGLSKQNIIKIRRGLLNRIWIAGYTSRMVHLHASEMEGLCFMWIIDVDKHPDLAENRRVRMKKHSRRVNQFMKRKRAERKAREGANG